MKNNDIKKKIAVFIVALTLVFSINIFATDTADGTYSPPAESGASSVSEDTAIPEDTAGAETTVQSEPKTTVITEYGIEVTVKSTKGEYAANEIPQLSLSVRNTNSYNIRNLIARANLPSALAYVGSNRAIVRLPEMQAGHSQTVDFQLKRASSSGGGGGSVNTADSDSSGAWLYILLGVAVLILAGAIIFAVSISKNKDKTKILTLFLCFGLALQSLPIVAEAQTDSGNFNVVHTIKYNSVEYGINILVSFGDAPVVSDPGNVTGSNAQGWENYQILDFSSSVRDVLVNESVNAKFSAVVLSSERGAQNPKLYEGNRLLGELKDDGQNGDATANDGIFTASVNLSSNTARNTEYFASFGTTRSDPVEICFYEEIEDESFDVFQSILDQINTKEDHNDVVSYLQSSEYVTSCFYDEATESVTFTTTFGIPGVWSKDENGMKKEGAFADSDFEFLSQFTQNLANTSAYNLSNKKIAVLRPFRGTDFRYDDFLTLAKATSNAIGGTVKDFKDSAVTLDVMSSLDEYGIVLIDSHGAIYSGISGQSDPYICIGQDFKDLTTEFSADYYSGRIAVTGGGRLAVNADFFKNRYGADSFDNTLFFLGTCYSMYDESISDVLIDRGAGVVFGYTDMVSVPYCNDTLKACMQTNLLNNKNTAIQAHTATLDSCGTTDPDVSNCRFVYDGNRNYSFVGQYGVIKGSVTAYETGSPIGWTRIQMTGDNGQRYDFIQNGGIFERKVEAGTYSVIISAYGCLSRTLSNVVITNGQTTYIEESLLLEGRLPDDSGVNVINGKVINAVNGEAVVGATVKFISSHGGTAGSSYVTDDSGNVIVLTTDENGAFSVSNLVKGYYTAEVSAEGYVVEYSNVLASTADIEQEITITPVLAETGEYRIVLSWGDTPRDLDAHIEGMWSASDYFHVYYANQNASRNGENVANLDIDDRSGYGPETITLTVDPTAEYVYYVRNYSGESPLYSSGAQVRVYQGNTLLETYNVPVEQVNGRNWNVFKIENGRIVNINQIAN